MQGSATLSSFDPRRFGVASIAGRRPVNEDAWSAAPQGGDRAEFYVVADGVGGQDRGDTASRAAVDAAVRAFQERRMAGDEPAAALRVAVETANQEVYHLARQLGVERMGCTLVAATLIAGHLHVAHVGDARAYLLQGTRLYRLTKDHTWVQEQVDLGTISAEDAAHHEFRHIVQRVLGNEAAVEATFGGPWAMGPGDRLLLTSDGVHDAVGDPRIVQLLGGAAPQAAADALVAEALAGGTEDNATALVVVAAAAAAARPASGSKRATERITTGNSPPVANGAPVANGIPVAPAPPPRRSNAGRALLLAALLVVGMIFLATALTGGDGAIDNTANETTAAALMTAPAPVSSTSPSSPTSTISPLSQAEPLIPNEGYPAPSGEIYRILPDRVVFGWRDERTEDGDLCRNADFRLTGDQVYLLSSEPRRMNAQREVGSCYQADFIQVRSVADSQQVGWILCEHLGSEVCER